MSRSSQSAFDNSTMQFMVNGTAYTTAELVAKAPATRRAPSIVKDESFHKGFRVVGHAPGAMETAEIDAKNALALFEEDRAQGRASGKPPKYWDENFWRNNQKKKPVRAKPYELRQSADLCAEIARKSGWLDVAVVELVHEARKPAAAH